MTGISRCARGIAVEVPDFDKAFPSPLGLADSDLLDAARSVAQHAEPFVQTFARYEMPAILDDLKSAIAEFSDATNESESTKHVRASATVTIDASIRKAGRILQQLDPIVANKLRANDRLLVEWAKARHIERTWKSKSEEADANSNPPNPTTIAAA